MDRELTMVIEDFDRAVTVEALRLANETSKPSFFNLLIIDPQGRLERVERERVEQERAGRERLEQQQERLEQQRLEREQVERERAQEREEQEFLFRRLKPVETSYHRDLCCMDGTRQSLLNHIMDWVANKLPQENHCKQGVDTPPV